MTMDRRLFSKHQLEACRRCVGGRIMGAGDDAPCVNCGWRPETAELRTLAEDNAPGRHKRPDKQAA